MCEREKQAAFFKELIQSLESERSRELQEKLDKVEREEGCIRSAMSLTIVLGLFSALGLGYLTVFVSDFSSTPLTLKFFGTLLVASGICLAGLIGFWCSCRAACNEVFDECRRLISSGHKPTWTPQATRAAALLAAESASSGELEARPALVPIQSHAELEPAQQAAS
jgi:hypothetical protein